MHETLLQWCSNGREDGAKYEQRTGMWALLRCWLPCPVQGQDVSLGGDEAMGSRQNGQRRSGVGSLQALVSLAAGCRMAHASFLHENCCRACC